MKFDPKIEELIEALEAEKLAGASACFRLALSCLEAYVEKGLEDLPRLCARLRAAKPAMGAIGNACSRCLRAAEGKSRTAVLKELRQLREMQADALPKIARAAVALVSPGARLITCSFSRTVQAALLAIQAAQPLEVVVPESRPLREGVRLAEELASKGCSTLLCTDAASCALVASCEAVFIGADAFGKDFVINKSGSLALGLAARHFKVPFYVLAESIKQVDALSDWAVEGAAEEIYEGGVKLRVVNPVFDLVPRSLVRRLVSEKD
jgi:translation initiation factor 2B subunit (eIF-2B alpha/beta/delta family)